MNVETAQKLKDAGYPFKLYLDEFKENHVIVGNNLIKLNDGINFTPTLSALIEACGNKFTMLSRENEFVEGEEVAKFSKDKRIWYSHGITYVYFEPDGDIDSVHNDSFSGSTPEEAVADLWLELNKKI